MASLGQLLIAFGVWPLGARWGQLEWCAVMPG